MQLLGVDINLSKTVISKDMMEFAKRLYLNNQEVTGFHTIAIIETIKSQSDFLGTFTNLCMDPRWVLSKQSVVSDLTKLFESFGLRKAYSRSRAKLIRAYYDLLEIQTTFDPKHLCLDYLRRRGLQFSCVQETHSKIFLFELLNSYKLKIIIDMLQVSTREINGLIKDHLKLLTEGGENNLHTRLMEFPLY